ncbi:MAG: type II secretion system protein [Candidatus Babeliales bacterium]
MKQSAFSLLELMIVIAIIGFLTMIAVPSFSRFMGKAKRVEAYMHLHALYSAQKMYCAEHGCYATALRGTGGLGWVPEGYSGGGRNERFYYTYGFGNGTEGTHYYTGKLETPAHNLSKARADKESFIIVAAGDIMNNGKPDILTVDQTGKITIVQDALYD